MNVLSRRQELGSNDQDGAAVRPAGSNELPPSPLVPKEGLWEGQVAVVAQTFIAGAVRGSLRGPGELVLGQHARIEGVIDCDRLDSQGEILGSIVTRSHVHLRPGARFDGDLETPTLRVDDDAVWNGVARVG